MCDYCRGYDGLDAAEGGPDEILIRWMFSGYPVIIVDHPHDNCLRMKPSIARSAGR